MVTGRFFTHTHRYIDQSIPCMLVQEAMYLYYLWVKCVVPQSYLYVGLQGVKKVWKRALDRIVRIDKRQ